MNRTQIAIAASGGAKRVAGELGVVPQTVTNWGLADKFPADKVKQLCAMTQGMITPSQVRPDIWSDA